jgi:hypothetical protein
MKRESLVAFEREETGFNSDPQNLLELRVTVEMEW